MRSRRELLTCWLEAFVVPGRVRLDPERCWAAQGQPCDYCVRECPLGEKALRFVGGVPRVGAACTGCGQCVAICTATPPALSVVPAN